MSQHLITLYPTRNIMDILDQIELSCRIATLICENIILGIKYNNVVKITSASIINTTDNISDRGS